MPNKRRTPRSRPASRPAALRRMRAPAASTDTSQQQSSGGGSRLTGRAAVLFLVMLVLLISYASSLRAWLQQRDDTVQARADVAEAKSAIADLEERRERLNDPDYIMADARARFGWVLPGETGYTVLDANGDVVGDDVRLPEQSNDDSGDDEEWYAKMWGSVQGAGQEPTDESDAQRTEKPDKGGVVRQKGLRR